MTSNEKRLLEELEFPSLYDSSTELKTIISEVNLENRASSFLYKGKYQVFLFENLLPWQKPIGHFFQTVIAICGVKPKLSCSSTGDESLCESNMLDESTDGNPLPVVFESLITPDTDSSPVMVIKRLKEKYNLYPLSEKIGRKILRLCDMIGEEFQIPYPVIILCHGKNPKSVSIPGTLKNEKLVHVLINSRGSISKYEQLPRLSTVKLDHLVGFVPSCTSLETSVYAQYDVLNHNKDYDFQPCANMDVVMECFWSNPSSILEPVATDSTCYVKVKAVIDYYSGASEKFKEIKLLQALCEGLDTGIINWPEFCSCENVLQKVEDFMKIEVTALHKRQKIESPKKDSKTLDDVVSGERLNLDFTDKLWLVLKYCSSCEELIEALNYIFEELSGLTDPPFVYPKKNSTIAMKIKNMREKRVSWPHLTFQLASQMLLEIGVEKLRGDYVSIFSELELVPYNTINLFFQPEIATVEAITCLLKLHSTLQITIIGLKCLNMSKDKLGEFVRNILKYYSVVPNVDTEHIFKFQIPPPKDLLDKMRPTIWELSLLSSDKDFKKQTVHHFSTSPHILTQVLDTVDYYPKCVLKNASYVHMTGTLIEDGFFGK